MSKKLVILADAQASAESIMVGELVDSLSNHSNVRIFSRKSFENSRMTPFFETTKSVHSNLFLFPYYALHPGRAYRYNDGLLVLFSRLPLQQKFSDHR